MTATSTPETFSIPRPRPGDLAEVVYENDAGAVTRRRIRVIAVHPSRYGHVYVRAYCFLRGEERTFRLDRFREWAPVTPIITPPPHPAPAITPPAPTPAPRPVSGSRRQRGRYGVGSAVAAGIFAAFIKLIVGGPEPEPPQYHVPPALLAAPVRSSPSAVPALTPAKRMYASADLDRSGHLSWSELKAFQVNLKRTERYLDNGTVLRPDQFLAQGGGDCDDWAVFTAGLLRYWGWEPYVGCFASPSGKEGHAVCLVRLNEAPLRFTCYTVPDGTRLQDGTPKPGYYVPVDYEVVGGISNAMGSDWKLEAIYVPESIYDASM